MVFDYNALSTWKTPELLSRDSRLVNKTRVMGMSEKAAIIHIVALVCTAGISLPINLGFCIWHAHRYGEVKKERTWIRQILSTRNMSYRGKGHWVEVQPTPNRAKKVPMQPIPNRGHKVQPTPNRGQRVQATRTPPANNDRQQYAQANVNAPVNNDPQMQYAQSNAYANAPVNNDLQMQYVQANANVSVSDSQQDFGYYADNNLQMQYVEANANVSVSDSQQDFGYYADNDLQMQYVEANAYASVNDYEQDFGNNADDDLQFEQAIGDSAMNDLEQDFGNNDVLSEAVVPGLLDLLAS